MVSWQCNETVRFISDEWRACSLVIMSNSVSLAYAINPKYRILVAMAVYSNGKFHPQCKLSVTTSLYITGNTRRIILKLTNFEV